MEFSITKTRIRNRQTESFYCDKNKVRIFGAANPQNYLKITGARRVTCNKFCTEDPKVFGAILQRLCELLGFDAGLTHSLRTKYKSISQNTTICIIKYDFRAICFDSFESSSGPPRNRSKVIKVNSAFWDPKRLQWVVQ